MLENLRRKSLVKNYIDPICQTSFGQGHAQYLDLVSLGQHTQKLSTEEGRKVPFQSTINLLTTPLNIPNIADGVKFNMIYCPKGSFTMGHEDQDDNKPRNVIIDTSFLLGETEITQELYEKVMNTNPSFYKRPQNPVENVSWVDAIQFCNKLSKLQGLDKCYTNNPKSLDYRLDCDFTKNGYRLPREKEWEYAAKAGTQNRWAGTDDESKLGEYAWFYKNSMLSTHLVGSKDPNEWGFYDMSGSVKEWCWDKYNPKGGADASRVTRGGGWYSNFTSYLRSAIRYGNSPNGCDATIGFRVARSIVN